MYTKEYISEFRKNDFDSYASIAVDAAKYMSKVIQDDDKHAVEKSKLELKLELEEKNIVLDDDTELDLFIHDLVEDIYQPDKY